MLDRRLGTSVTHMAVRVYNYSSKTPSSAEPLLGELSLDYYIKMTGRLVKLSNLKSVGHRLHGFRLDPKLSGSGCEQVGTVSN